MAPPTETASYAETAADVSTWIPARVGGRVAGPAPETIQEPRASLRRRFLDDDRTCRALNIAAAVVLLLVSLPVMALIAVAVRLSSPGPVIFRQPRVGLDRRNGDRRMSGGQRKRDHGGRLFDIYKFRTMYVAEGEEGEEGEQVWAGSEESRITPVGRVLRAFRLDELPQLWNVLKGDMNIVGPRPEQPRIFEELRDELDHYPVRQKVLPGITGLAQVTQGYDETVEDVRNKLRYDLEYIENRSPLEDLRIMVRTAPVMFLRRGAR